MAYRRPKKLDTEKPQDPPMTSMIDVIFQLLIFFILTLKVKTVEGKLLSELPKDKGLAPNPVSQPETQEVRIVLCVTEGNAKEIERHTANKGAHEANLEFLEAANLEATKTCNSSNETYNRWHKPHIIINDICVAYVERNEIGRLYKTFVCRDGSHLEETGLKDTKRLAENHLKYKEIAAKAKELYDATPSRKDPTKKAPVILDADSAVPYEFVVGVVNALKALNPPIENVEFVGNSRFPRFYGTGEGDQFKNYREDADKKRGK